MKKRFFVEIEYADKSLFNFNVELEGSTGNILATLMMITRGTLMASMGNKATAYNEDGFDVVSYIK